MMAITDILDTTMTIIRILTTIGTAIIIMNGISITGEVDLIIMVLTIIIIMDGDAISIEGGPEIPTHTIPVGIAMTTETLEK